MPNFASGVVRFQKDIFPTKKALFEKLSHGQAPEALFITCSDSRIEIAMLTQSVPGDLLISRNAGNIVPPHTTNTGAMTATIEFAVAALKVPHIVVCGHTDCGAIKGAMNPEGLEGMPHTKEWLSFAKAAVDIVNEIGEGKSEAERSRMVHEQNVILQLQHLKTHPTVAAHLAKGDLELHGWIYDVRSGEVKSYDESEKEFVPVEEFYADQAQASAEQS